jgi:membrane protein
MFLKQGWRLLRAIITNFFNEGCPMMASGLAYISLLAIVPLMTVSLSVLAVFPAFKGIGEQIQKFIFDNFVTSSAQTIHQYLQAFMSQATKLSLPSTLSLLITAVLMIFAIEYNFNKIWHIQKHRNAIQAFLMYWAVLTLAPILIGVGFVITGTALHTVINKTISDMFPYLFTFLALTLLYTLVPNCKVKIRYAMPGAIIATILFELAKHSFAFYITNFPTYTLIYGALAAIPIFLVWLYLSWLIVLFGASVSHTLQQKID